MKTSIINIPILIYNDDRNVWTNVFGNITTTIFYNKSINKSIIELYSVELKADVHYTKSAKTATYSQSGSTITITLNSHGFSAGLILTFITLLRLFFMKRMFLVDIVIET